jgi:hypothetical protein
VAKAYSAPTPLSEVIVVREWCAGAELQGTLVKLLLDFIRQFKVDIALGYPALRPTARCVTLTSTK